MGLLPIGMVYRKGVRVYISELMVRLSYVVNGCLILFGLGSLLSTVLFFEDLINDNGKNHLILKWFMVATYLPLILSVFVYLVLPR